MGLMPANPVLVRHFEVRQAGRGNQAVPRVRPCLAAREGASRVSPTFLRRHVAILWECTGCSARHPWILRQPGSPTPLVPPGDDARQFPKTGR